jgi:parallel beta-helix repeat protein
MVKSLGFIRENVIKQNARSGILTADETRVTIDNNEIEEN